MFIIFQNILTSKREEELPDQKRYSALFETRKIHIFASIPLNNFCI